MIRNLNMHPVLSLLHAKGNLHSSFLVYALGLSMWPQQSTWSASRRTVTCSKAASVRN
jgi:hypothetical protein